jgi:hypothetical protein
MFGGRWTKFSGPFFISLQFIATMNNLDSKDYNRIFPEDAQLVQELQMRLGIR